MTGYDEIFKSDVYDDGVVVSWGTARESPGLTGDNAKIDNRESIEQCILLKNTKMNMEVEMLTPYTKLAPLMMFS